MIGVGNVIGQADYAYFANSPDSPSRFAANRQRNLCLYDALHECDVSVTPSWWQYSRFPSEFLYKIRTIHDSVDTNYFSPLRLVENSGENEGEAQIHGLDIASMKEVVTFATRGLERHRGFPEFYRSLPAVLQARPHCHVIIMANDEAYYSPRYSKEKTWGEAMREEVALDMDRVHFVPYSSYSTSDPAKLYFLLGRVFFACFSSGT